ncbi:cation transporter [uncultured Sphaerochaeta sp.]|uniref:cation transporter n=1 Tax=uncultured Sphaerochaeta sp. TaxID=886478 RepID=UPI002A0A29F0|nr:cation transporter [uncultured Sphaerochaeta sp.]
MNQKIDTDNKEKHQSSISQTVKNWFKPKENVVEVQPSGEKPLKKLLIIEGMSCGHCTMKVKSELMDVKGVTQVQVNLTKQSALVEGFHLNNSDLMQAVKTAGYCVTQILGQ